MDKLGFKISEQRLDAARPFLKWAGSKQKLLAQIRPLLPTEFGRYFEPFLGSGSIFFAVQPNVATLSDLCLPLIETYITIRNDPDAVMRSLDSLVVEKDAYYAIRASRPRTPVRKAARFIYLNKTCWNGLYRENLKGEFNVPFGAPRSQKIYDPISLRSASAMLAKPGVTLAQCDFETTLAQADKDDLVFLDPPYVTTHNDNGFVEYNGRIFSWADQERLADVAQDLRRRGAHVVVTNADHPAVTKLYRGFRRASIARHSTLASRLDRRVPVTETVFY